MQDALGLTAEIIHATIESRRDLKAAGAPDGGGLLHGQRKGGHLECHLVS